jgi:hypothetical protein
MVLRPAVSGYLTALRVLVIGATLVTLALFGLLLLLGYGFTRPGALSTALPVVLGLADLVLVPAAGSTIRPLSPGASEQDARRTSVRVLRTITVLRWVLAEAPAVFGLVGAVLAHSAVPLVIGLAFALPLLVLLAYPRAAVVEALRDRLESAGTRSHLWDAAGGRQPAVLRRP